MKSVSSVRGYKPAPGTYLYRAKNGAAVFTVHFTADVLKRSADWRDLVASDFDEGIHSVGFKQEYEIDFWVASGDLMFYAFRPELNICDPFEIPHDWTWWIAADQGEHTAFIMLCQDPRTQCVYVVREWYFFRKEKDYMQWHVHKGICEARGINPIGGTRTGDFLEDGVSDPSNPTMAREFGVGPFPVDLRTKGWNTEFKINDHVMTYGRCNGWMRPSFFCCGKRFTPADDSENGVCPKCRKVRAAAPLLRIFDGYCPNLVRTLPEIVKQDAAAEGYEAPDKEKAGQEDHLTDCLRYGLAIATIETPAQGSQQTTGATWEHELLARIVREAEGNRDQMVPDFEGVGYYQKNAEDDDNTIIIDPLDQFEEDQYTDELPDPGAITSAYDR